MGVKIGGGQRVDVTGPGPDELPIAPGCVVPVCPPTMSVTDDPAASSSGHQAVADEGSGVQPPVAVVVAVAVAVGVAPGRGVVYPHAANKQSASGTTRRGTRRIVMDYSPTEVRG